MDTLLCCGLLATATRRVQRLVAAGAGLDLQNSKGNTVLLTMATMRACRGLLRRARGSTYKPAIAAMDPLL